MAGARVEPFPLAQAKEAHRHSERITEEAEDDKKLPRLVEKRLAAGRRLKILKCAVGGHHHRAGDGPTQCARSAGAAKIWVYRRPSQWEDSQREGLTWGIVIVGTQSISLPRMSRAGLLPVAGAVEEA